MATFFRATFKSAKSSLTNHLGSRMIPVHVEGPLLITRASTSAYSTAPPERSEDPRANHFYIPRWIIYVFIPSTLTVYGYLTFLEGNQSEIRQNLKDENKHDGRAHGCIEVHQSDIEKWAEAHPEHSEHWHKVKRGFSEHTASEAKRQATS